MYAAGLTLFAFASAACALAPDVGWLIGARAVQGAGAALLMPLGLALLTAAFPPEKRGAAIGLFSAVTGISVALGPLVGGAVVEGIAWEWIFWLNVPIGLLAAPLALSKIRRATARTQGRAGRAEVAGRPAPGPDPRPSCATTWSSTGSDSAAAGSRIRPSDDGRAVPVRRASSPEREDRAWRRAKDYTGSPSHECRHVRLPDDRRGREPQGALDLHGPQLDNDHAGPRRRPDAWLRARGCRAARRLPRAERGRAEDAVRAGAAS